MKITARRIALGAAFVGVVAIIMAARENLSSDDPRFLQLVQAIDAARTDQTGYPMFMEVAWLVKEVFPEIHSHNVMDLFGARAVMLDRNESGACFSAITLLDLRESQLLSIGISSEIKMTFSGCNGSDSLIAAESAEFIF